MKNLYTVIVLSTLLTGCQALAEKAAEPENMLPEPVDTVEAVNAAGTPVTSTIAAPVDKMVSYEITWADSLLSMYIAFAENKAIKETRKNNMRVEWIYDTTLHTDSAVYDTYRIGHDVLNEGSENIHFVIDQWVYIDTAKRQLYEYNEEEETLAKWWSAADTRHFFYPVYELSPKTTAFVVGLNEYYKKSFLDTVFNRLYPFDSLMAVYDYNFYKKSPVAKKWKLYDSSGFYRLMRSDQFEKEARKYFEPEVYVYGTNGVAKSRIKNVAFGLYECVSSVYAFCLERDSLKNIGHPIFCSDRLIDIQYGKDYSKLEKKVHEFFLAMPNDYADSVQTKIVGHIDDFYFMYHDDFLWGRKTAKAKSKFPDRGMWMIEGRKVATPFFADGLDLFGIGCD